MRRSLSLLLLFGILCVPLKTAAQSSQSLQPASSAGQPCEGTKVHVRVKLKNGKSIKGDLVERNAQEVTLCADSVFHTFPASEVKEVSSRQTEGQRAQHRLRVVGIIFLSFLAYGTFIVIAKSREQ